MSEHDPTTEAGTRKRRRRRRRRARGRRPGMFLLPHLFTTGNLFFGFYAIVQATMGAPDRAAIGIILAVVCDIFDGRAARLAGSSSPFGGEYDSIADTVSFGVAPAMLAFAAGNLAVLGRPGWVMAFLYTACAALRLARFNVSPGRYKGRFEGLPSPAAAGMIASTAWFFSFLREIDVVIVVPETLVAAGTATLGLLMVSSIPYRSFKEFDVRQSFGSLVVTVLVLALIIQEPKVSLFAVGVCYMLAGPVEWLWRRAAGRPLTEVPETLVDESAQG